MADNAYKRAIVNSAIMKFSGGHISSADVLFDDLDDDYFTAPFTNVPAGRNDILVSCVKYEEVLLRVIKDLKPDFAKHFADLGAEIRINKEIADWKYMFELPSDYLIFIRQLSQTDRKTEYEAKVKYFRQYAHIVSGTDDQTYYCISAHTAAAANKPITGANYATYWSLYDEDDYGADWISGWSYKSSQTGFLLVTNDYSNEPSETVDDDIDSAYIEYIPYVQGGINDEPQYYDEDFKNAFATLLGSELSIAIGKDYERRMELLREYRLIAGPDFMENQAESGHIPERKTIWENSRNLTLPG